MGGMGGGAGAGKEVAGAAADAPLPPASTKSRPIKYRAYTLGDDPGVSLKVRSRARGEECPEIALSFPGIGGHDDPKSLEAPKLFSDCLRMRTGTR